MTRAEAQAELDAVNVKMRAAKEYVDSDGTAEPPMSVEELRATMKRWDELLWLLSVGDPD